VRRIGHELPLHAQRLGDRAQADGCEIQAAGGGEQQHDRNADEHRFPHFVLLALGGHVIAQSARGKRTIDANQLFSGVFETALETDEMVVEAWFPASPKPFAILEESRRHGDFALAGVVRADTRLALFGVASTPVLADVRDPTRGLQPSGDLEATPDFRLHLVRVLTGKAFAA